VIRANQNNINFDGFKELLSRFEGVIKDYNQKNAQQAATDGQAAAP
jgi:hypothetical protein